MANAYALGEAASRTTGQVDSLFLFIAGISLFFFLLVEGLLIYFAVKYRRRKGTEPASTPDIRSHVLLETVWIVIPSIVVVAFFYYGYLVFRDLRAPVPGAADIHVTGRQFLFEFTYPDGRSSINELRVQAGAPVKLILSSDDVIHSFFIPAYRIKQDMVPGRYTTLYLHPDRPGTYEILCAEYCGVGHSTMRASLIVMEPAEYARWREGEEAAEAGSLAEQGKALVEKSGCLGCHALEGKAKVGPNFGGLYGRKVLLADGTSLVADEEYIRESILEPNARVVKGYPSVMPTYKTILSAEEVAAVIAYFKSLSGAEKEEVEGAGEKGEPGKGKGGEERDSAAAREGEQLAGKLGCLGCHSLDGSVKAGPSFQGLFGRKVEFEGGGTGIADEAYIRESITRPGAKVVKGFPDIMPAFGGKIAEEDLEAVVGYIRTVK